MGKVQRDYQVDENGTKFFYDIKGGKRNEAGQLMKGGKGIGGRKKGSKNICPIKMRQSLLNRLKGTTEDGQPYGDLSNPLEVMLQIVGSPVEDNKVRIAAANVVMPYIMPKLTAADLHVKGSMEVTGDQAADKLRALIAKGLGGIPEDGDEALEELGIKDVEDGLKETL
jgi:hypothetical protein